MNSIRILCLIGVFCPITVIWCQDNHGQLDVSNDLVEVTSTEPFFPPLLTRFNNLLPLNQTALQTIEILVITDYSFYQKWLKLSDNNAKQAHANINFHLSHVFQGVNDIYAGIGEGLRFRVKVVDMIIHTRPEQSSYSEKAKTRGNMLDLWHAMPRLPKWLRDSKPDLPKFDVSVAYTSYTGEGPTGLAVMASMCTHKATLIRSHSISQDTLVTAHEIGHTLNAKHDGVGNGCSAKQHHIMAPFHNVQQLENFPTFSPCSIREMKVFVNLMNRNNKNCLVNKANPLNDYVDLAADVAQMPGIRFDADHQCKQFYGMTSYYCSEGAYTHKGICGRLACWIAAKGICVIHEASRPARGTMCGSGRWCYEGKCVHSQDAPKNSDFCLYGDYYRGMSVNSVLYSCNKLPKRYCKNTAVYETCCESCQSFSSTKSRNNGFHGGARGLGFLNTCILMVFLLSYFQNY